MVKPLIKIENVSLAIPGCQKTVLNNISFQIYPGYQYAILGANGSGKSTLLRLIHGDLWPSIGKISWLGKQGYEESPIYGRSISEIVSPLVQENCQRQNWQVSCADILAGAFTNTPMSFFVNNNFGPSVKEQIIKILDTFNCLNLLNMRVPELSQGQLRIILLCRALLRKPKLLLLDEFSEGLDEERKILIFRELDKLSSETTMIFASHRMKGLPDWPLHYHQMEKGYLDGPLSANKMKEYLFTNKPLAQKKTSDGYFVGVPKEVVGGDRKILVLKNIFVYIDRLLTLKNINWCVSVGENWQIKGPNGSGKSTLLRLLAGDEFYAAGGSLTRWSPGLQRNPESLEEIHKTVSLVSDLGQALFAYNLTGHQLVCSGFDNTIGIYRNFTKEENDRASWLIDTFFPGQEAGLIAQSYIRSLSSGQLKRLFLARALVKIPDLLLLDEPCTGLDAASRQIYFDILNRLVAQQMQGYKTQIIFVSHFEEDVPEFINRHARMENGTLFIKNKKYCYD